MQVEITKLEDIGRCLLVIKGALLQCEEKGVEGGGGKATKIEDDNEEAEERKDFLKSPYVFFVNHKIFKTIFRSWSA